MIVDAIKLLMLAYTGVVVGGFVGAFCARAWFQYDGPIVQLFDLYKLGATLVEMMHMRRLCFTHGQLVELDWFGGVKYRRFDEGVIVFGLPTQQGTRYVHNHCTLACMRKLQVGSFYVFTGYRYKQDFVVVRAVRAGTGELKPGDVDNDLNAVIAFLRERRRARRAA